jgi:hypothetical protein
MTMIRGLWEEKRFEDSFRHCFYIGWMPKPPGQGWSYALFLPLQTFASAVFELQVLDMISFESAFQLTMHYLAFLSHQWSLYF